MPFWLILSFTWLFQTLGYSVFLGMSITCLSMAINYYSNKAFTKLHERNRELNRERHIETNHTIENIKMLKLYGWQNLFEKRVTDARRAEIEHSTANMWKHKLREWMNSMLP